MSCDWTRRRTYALLDVRNDGGADEVLWTEEERLQWGSRLEALEEGAARLEHEGLLRIARGVEQEHDRGVVDPFEAVGPGRGGVEQAEELLQHVVRLHRRQSRRGHKQRVGALGESVHAGRPH